MRQGWVAVAVVGVLFGAGCATPTEGGSQVSVHYESGSIEVEDTKPDGDLANGTLHGRVRDTLNVSIPDAAVSLLGTQGFAMTNETGAFVMEGLPPGRHVLRIDPAERYVAIEEVVEVEAGAAVMIVVTVPYRDDVPAGFRPHVHDYWDEDGTYTMYEGLLEWPDAGTTGAAERTLYTQLYSSDHYYRLPFLFPDEPDEHQPILVIPGTKSITITLDWDSNEVRADKLGVWYVTPDVPCKNCRGAWKSTGVAAAGTELIIDVSSAQWDNAHQGFTFWGFGIDIGFAIMDLYADNTPVVVDGPIEVSVVLSKGTDPPLDPPHPDWWEENTTMPIPVSRHPAYYDRYLIDAGYIVAPGTERMLVNVTWTNRLHMDALGVEWDMRFRTADQDPLRTPASMMRSKDFSSCGTDCRSYDIELQPGWADGWYQEDSLWAFYMYSEDQGSTYQPLVTGAPGYSFEVRAYKADRGVA